MAHANNGGGISNYKTLYEKTLEELRKQQQKSAAQKVQTTHKNTTAKPTMADAAATASAKAYQRLQELYSMQSKGAKNSFDSSLSQYDADKNAHLAKIDSTSNNAHQQAYISYMLQKKEMPQLLAAMGISGGGAESTLSSMQNTYGQSRNKIDTQRNESLSDIEAQYNKLKSEARKKYDQQIYEYDLQYQQKSAGL